MHLQPGLEKWRSDCAKIDEKTKGIVWVVGVILHWCLWASLSQWASLALPKDRLDSFTEWYVFVVMLLSGGIYFVPSVWLALLSTWFSAGTVIVMLHVVLLQRVFGSIASAERSILLIMCNVAQIVFMFATWYRLGGEPGPLLKSILTFATIGYAKTMPGVAMTQIATDFVLLFIFLGFLLGQLGPKNVTE
jgi:hypothetical protein